MVLAASPAIARNDSSVIGVRAKPTIAYRSPSELYCARSYIAGNNLAFGQVTRSPK